MTSYAQYSKPEPEFVALLNSLPATDKTNVTLEDYRTALQVLPNFPNTTYPGPKDCDTSETTIPVRDGTSIPVRIYSPHDSVKGDALPSILFHIHGGGWVGGTLDLGHPHCLWFSSHNVVVVNIDYRVCPENAWNVPQEDCYDVYRAVHKAAVEGDKEQLNKWGIPAFDTDKVFLYGTSAGAQMATACTILDIENGRQGKIRGLFLHGSSSVDPHLFPTEKIQGDHSMIQNKDAPFLDARDVERYVAWRNSPAEADRFFSPLVALSDEVLKQFPMVFNQVYGMDCFRDGHILFAERMKELGVDNAPRTSAPAPSVPTSQFVISPELSERFIDNVNGIRDEWAGMKVFIAAIAGYDSVKPRPLPLGEPRHIPFLRRWSERFINTILNAVIGKVLWDEHKYKEIKAELKESTEVFVQDLREMTSTAQSLRSLVFATYKRALKNGSLQFSETEAHALAYDGIKYGIRYAPNLLKKPTSQPTNAGQKAPNPIVKANPFLPPNPALYVNSLLQSHYIVLNKFPVIPGHFILATNEFEKQGYPLAVGDLKAVLEVVRGWENDNGCDTEETPEEARSHKSLYGFFNSGRESGASQPHRHIQFVPLKEGEMDELWATQMFRDSAGENGIVEGTVGDMQVRYQSKVAYKHYFVRVPVECDGEKLWRMYTMLLSLAEYTLLHPTTPAEEVINDISERWDTISATQRPMDADVPFSYNMSFTKGWMGILPRTAETVYVVDKEEDSGVEMDGVKIKCPGLNLNGTAMAGMMLVRTRKEMDVVLNDPSRVAGTIGGIGVPQHGLPKSSL
ncbi:hypothetical protein H072_5257 [Dactylellina haptotyla CBS 200.50]|uniref:Alpha/beta hydrolase fold-3 domain-containing protein n=1 Tax=Dactylellina haptotyla (strain CBS 200.50) TaxID=1284197 RepID=S8AIA3_DACHA|nr:hypothetical protein H072_5257 [Dactylellina haptotyla CBS 200.50]